MNSADPGSERSFVKVREVNFKFDPYRLFPKTKYYYYYYEKCYILITILPVLQVFVSR